MTSQTFIFVSSKGLHLSSWGIEFTCPGSIHLILFPTSDFVTICPDFPKFSPKVPSFPLRHSPFAHLRHRKRPVHETSPSDPPTFFSLVFFLLCAFVFPHLHSPCFILQFHHLSPKFPHFVPYLSSLPEFISVLLSADWCNLRSWSIPVTDPIDPTIAPVTLIRSKPHPGFRQRIGSN